MSQSSTAGHKRYALRSADRSSSGIPHSSSASRPPEAQRTPVSRPSSRGRSLSTSTWQAAQLPPPPASLHRQTSAHGSELRPRTSPAVMLDLSLPLKDLKYRDLAFACRQRGLRPRGKKTVLIQQLIDDGYADPGFAKKTISPEDEQYDQEGSLTVTTSLTQSRKGTPARTRRARANVGPEENKSPQVGNPEIVAPIKLQRKLRSSTRVMRDSTGAPTENPSETLRANTLEQEAEVTQHEKYTAPQQTQAGTKGKRLEPNLAIPQQTNSVAANSSVPPLFLPRRSLRMAQPLVPPSQPVSLPTTPTLVPADEANQVAMSSTSFQSTAPRALNSTLVPPALPLPQTVPQQRLQTLQMLRRMCDCTGGQQRKGQSKSLPDPPIATINWTVEKAPGGVAGLNRVGTCTDRDQENPTNMTRPDNWQLKRIQDSKRPYEDLQDPAVGGPATERHRKIRKRRTQGEKRGNSDAVAGVPRTPTVQESLQTPPRKSPLVFRHIATPERTLSVLLESSPTTKTESQSPLIRRPSIYSDRREQRILGRNRTQSNVRSEMRARRSWSSDLRVKSLPTGDVVRGHTLIIERGVDWSDEEDKRGDSRRREELLRERMKNISEDIAMDSARVGRTVSEVVRRSPFEDARAARKKRNIIGRLFKSKRKIWM